jgi:hypothetical protein
MKLLKTHYATIFLASLYTISSYGGMSILDKATVERCSQTLWPHAQELHQLIKSGSSEELKTVFKAQPALINRNISPEHPLTPLSQCLSYRQTSEHDLCNIVQTLIDCGADVNTQPNWIPHGQKYLPIMIATKEHSSARLLEILFSHGADSNAKNSRGTILHHLIYQACGLKVFIGDNEHPFTTLNQNKKFLALIQKALEYGADPYLKNSHGKDSFDALNDHRNNSEYYWKDYCFRAWRGTINHNAKTEYLEFLNQIESLLKVKYLKPTKIIKTDTHVHLTYTFQPLEN